MKTSFTSIVFLGEKYWVAKCVELGVVSQGETQEEALLNLQEAVECYLENDSRLIPKTPSFVSNFEVEYA